MVKDKKKLARVIATWVVTSVMVSVFLLDILVVHLLFFFAHSTHPLNPYSRLKRKRLLLGLSSP